MKSLILGLFCLLGLPLTGLAFDHNYENLNHLLKENVVSINNDRSLVKYGNLRRNSQEMKLFVKEVQAVTKEEYDQWSKDQQLAFLINTYNGMTIYLITQHLYEIDSIKGIGGIFQNPFKREFFTLFGEPAYLNLIQHEMIRTQFKEPRTHFALVSAAISSPALRKEAYVAKKLEAQLEDQTIKFLKDINKNIFIPKNPAHVRLSPIFEWYGDDFKEKYGDLKKFLMPYLVHDDPYLQRLFMQKNTHLTFRRYNWNLNRYRNE